MSEYTPTTEQVRHDYASHHERMTGGYEDGEAKFDRWLAAHDAQVRAEAEASILESPTHHIVSQSGTIWTRDRAESGTDLAGNLLASVQKVRADRERAEAERTLPSEEEVGKAIAHGRKMRWQRAHQGDCILDARVALAKIASAPTVEQVRQEERERIAKLPESDALLLWWEACADEWAVPNDLPAKYLRHVMWVLDKYPARIAEGGAS